MPHRAPLSSRRAITAIERAVRALPSGPLLIAVSGGRDSMVLLDALARTTHRDAQVATFDHGTSAAAAQAVRLVVARATALGLPVTADRARRRVATEAAWRAQRYRFLSALAVAHRATIVTAHTADDQTETVFMRLLRAAGPRGLAGMAAASPIARPLLAVTRAEIDAYAAAREIAFIDDPTNADPHYLRNRVRHELLPAFEAVRPGFRRWLISLGDRAAALRAEVAAAARAAGVRQVGAQVIVPRSLVIASPAAFAALWWPEVASWVGLTVDRRGLARVLEWAPRAAVGSSIQLSRGGELQAHAHTIVVTAPEGTGTSE
ncbi:MAG: tRNA lysidine(34) synthetase TilS [Gemmatimonadaceae bacterium]|nr:tRNA lysidine(34) synthetase TilS [Gemmatimonadaceae bacterium]